MLTSDGFKVDYNITDWTTEYMNFTKNIQFLYDSVIEDRWEESRREQVEPFIMKDPEYN